MNIIECAKKEQDYLVSLRREFHRYPELSGKEEETIKRIKRELEKYQIPYIEVENGGILGIIDSGKKGQTVLLRADCDALPVLEDPCNEEGNAKPCVSLIDNVQHACGHDAHMTMLLGAGKILSEHKDEFCGKIVLCFERGEEGIGNIYYLLKYFNENDFNFDTCFGIHVGASKNHCPGKIVMKDGDFMAAMILFDFTIVGKGSHGAKPELANSPIKCFAHIYDAISEMYQKEFMDGPIVKYSIGHVTAGEKCNVIPDTLNFEGTIRYYDSENGGFAFLKRMKEVMEDICQKEGCHLQINKENVQGYPVVNNNDCFRIAKEAFGTDFDIEECDAKMISESFSYYQRYAPGLFINLSTTNKEKGNTADLHQAKMDVEEDVLYLGTAAHIYYALEFLKEERKIDFVKKKIEGKELDRILFK